MIQYLQVYSALKCVGSCTVLRLSSGANMLSLKGLLAAKKFSKKVKASVLRAPPPLSGGFDDISDRRATGVEPGECPFGRDCVNRFDPNHQAKFTHNVIKKRSRKKKKYAVQLDEDPNDEDVDEASATALMGRDTIDRAARRLKRQAGRSGKENRGPYVHHPDQTVEEREIEKKFIQKRIIQEGDQTSVARINKVQQDCTPGWMVQLKHSNANMHIWDQKPPQMTRVDKLRIATRFWLNINLRKTMNSWVSFHAQAKLCKRILDSALQHWGIARLKYGLRRWHLNTRVKFEKKTYFRASSKTLVTVMIRTAVFEEPRKTEVLLSQTVLSEKEYFKIKHRITKVPSVKLNTVEDQTTTGVAANPVVACKSPIREIRGTAKDMISRLSPTLPTPSSSSLSLTQKQLGRMKDDTRKILQGLMDQYYEGEVKKSQEIDRRESAVERLVYEFATETRQVPTSRMVDSVATIVQ